MDKKSVFTRLRDGLKKTRGSFTDKVDMVLTSFKKVDEELFENLWEALITADIGAETATEIIDSLRERARAGRIFETEKLRSALRDIIAEMMDGGAFEIDKKPAVLLIIGVNGTGKTTSAGKLAAHYGARGKKVLLAAADTFRAAAIEQLEIWGRRAGADIIKQHEGADPASVVFDAIAASKSRGTDVLICDTAGRLHNKKNLMDELGKIRRIIGRELPAAQVETLLTLDATTGQNAINQAKAFAEAGALTGIILTKLDGTAKGGVTLSIKKMLGVPVRFVGVGEGIDDLRLFDPKEFAAALFNRGSETNEEEIL